jgi:single-strand DNA-binding protein
MTNMINKVYLTGNLGHAADIRTTQDGREMATLSLATNSSWKDDQGEWQYRTDWHRIIVFREETVQWIKKSLRRGDSLLVEGKLSYSEFEDKLNQKRKISCVIVSGRESRVHLLRPGKPYEKDKLFLYKDADNLSLPPLNDQNISTIKDIPFLKKNSSKLEFKERASETTGSSENNIVPLNTPSLTTGENPYDTN